MLSLAVSSSSGIRISLIFLLILILNPCHGLASCKAEKAINHMMKILKVDSYVFNDTHLLNINNKGIKILSRDILDYYANKHREKIEFIYVCYNNLNDIEAGMFEEFVNVRNINVGVNLLETIKRNYFRGITKIDFLNFQSNLIHSIERGSFDELTQLEYVYLDDNCLTHIPERLFYHNTRIQSIFLQQNRLVHLGNSFMRSSQRLFSLNIAENRLKEISNLFRFQSLISLIASNNKLNSIRIDDGGVSDSEMTSLSIENTTLNDLSFINHLPRLRELYASHNSIKSFNIDNFSNSKELFYISLHSNPLTSLNTENANEILPKLEILDISKTPLEANCPAILDLYTQNEKITLNFNLKSTTVNECL